MRTYLWILAILASLIANIGAAKCQGQDLRPGLGPNDRSAIEARLSNIRYTSGNHWRATRDGKTIHLIGTIHISDPRLDQITQNLRGVVESSEVLLLEMTPLEQDALKKDMSQRPELLFLQDASLPDMLSEQDWQALSNAMQERGVPAMIASRFQPWYLSIMLAMPPCLAQQMANTTNGLDHRFMDIAEAAGIPMKALEKHDTLFTLFNDEPLEEQIDVMLLGLQTADSSEDMLATVQEAYFDQRHAEAWELSRLQVMAIKGETPERLEALFAEMEADLLTTRNQAWMSHILAAHKAHAQITVAVGAGHFSGELGLLSLLEAQGFQLERLPF